MNNGGLQKRVNSQLGPRIPAIPDISPAETNSAHLRQSRQAPRCHGENQTDFITPAMPLIAPRNLTAPIAFQKQEPEIVKVVKKNNALGLGSAKKGDDDDQAKEGRTIMPITRVTGQVGYHPSGSEGLPKHSRLKRPSSLVKAPKKIAKRTGRPPLPIKKRSSAKSNRNQPTKAESSGENDWSCFSEENEPVMRRVLQELERDFDSGFFDEGTSRTNGSGTCRSVSEKTPNRSTTDERGQETQAPGIGRTAVPNSSETLGNLGFSQLNANNHHQLRPQVPGNPVNRLQGTTQMEGRPSFFFSYTFPQAILPSVTTHAGPQSASEAQYPAWNPMFPSQHHIYRFQQPLGRPVGGTIPTYQPPMNVIPRTVGGPIMLLNPVLPQHAFFQHPVNLSMSQSYSNNNVPGPTGSYATNEVGRQPSTQQDISLNKNAQASAASTACLRPKTSPGQTNYTQNMTSDKRETGIRSTARKARKTNHSGRAEVSREKKLPVKRKQTRVSPSARGVAASKEMRVKSQMANKKERGTSSVGRKPKPKTKTSISTSVKAQNGGMASTSGKVKHQKCQSGNDHMKQEQPDGRRGNMSITQPISGTFRPHPGHPGGSVMRAKTETQIDGVPIASTGAKSSWGLAHQHQSNTIVPRFTPKVPHGKASGRKDSETIRSQVDKGHIIDRNEGRNTAKFSNQTNSTGTKNKRGKRNAPLTSSHHVPKHITGNASLRNKDCIGLRVKGNNVAVSQAGENLKLQSLEQREDTMNKPLQGPSGPDAIKTQAVSGFRRQCENPKNLRYNAFDMSRGDTKIQKSSFPNATTSFGPAGNTLAHNQLLKHLPEDGNEEKIGPNLDLAKRATRGATASTHARTASESTPSPYEQIQSHNGTYASFFGTNCFSQSRANGNTGIGPQCVTEPPLMMSYKQRNVNTRQTNSSERRSDLEMLLNPAPPDDFYAGKQLSASSFPFIPGTAPQFPSHVPNTAHMRDTPNGPSVPPMTGAFQTHGSALIGPAQLGAPGSSSNPRREVDGWNLYHNNSEKVVPWTAWDPITPEEF